MSFVTTSRDGLAKMLDVRRQARRVVVPRWFGDGLAGTVPAAQRLPDLLDALPVGLTEEAAAVLRRGAGAVVVSRVIAVNSSTHRRPRNLSRQLSHRWRQGG
jgi:hypothetical protein